MRVSFVFILTLFAFVSISAQFPLDSLKKTLDQTKDARQRADLIASIAQSFFVSSQYDSLGKYADALLKLSSNLKDQKLEWIAEAYKAQSFARIDSSEFFTRSKSILIKSEKNKFIPGIAITCLGIGSRLLTLGKYDQATVYLLKGFEAIDNQAEPEWIGIKSDLIRTISAVYHHQGNYTEALDYALQSSRLAEQSAVPMQLMKSYLNLSGLYGELSSPENGLGVADDRLRYQTEAKKYMKLSYKFSIINASKLTQGATAFNLGSLYAEDKQEDSARYFLNEAIRLGSATNFYELLSNAYRMKSTLYPTLLDSAVHYLDLAYRYADKAQNPITRIATSLDKAKVLISQQKWTEAEKLTLKSLTEAKQLNLLNDQRSANLILYEIKNHQQEYLAALTYYKNYNSIKDSIINEKNFARIEELKTKYESELKDSEIKNLEQKTALQDFEIKQKNYFIVGLSIVAILAAALIYFYYSQRTLRQQQKALELENRFLRVQLDPHFLSNSLVSIQRFVMENNTEQAVNYLTKFSRLMRQLLEYSREELITIEEEIDLLKNYLDIQKLRLKDKFEYRIQIDKNLSIADSKIQPMFAQPFVENAIEHGISQVENGKIELSFTAWDGQLVLEIRDNGNGIQKNANNPQSLSTKIIRERIDLLNKANRTRIQLTIENLSTGTGTRVQIILPIYS
jgi:two-component sensor histidine kinase